MKTHFATLQLELEIGADGEGKNCLNIAAVETDIGGSAAIGKGAALEIDLNREI
jgi:hypothetical protein